MANLNVTASSGNDLTVQVTPVPTQTIQINRGVTGAQGPVGPQGPTGPQGDPATVNVGTTTTGNPGTPAEVINIGTEVNAVLDFTIPQGEKGNTGIGLPTGGMTGQVVVKLSNTNFDIGWTSLGTAAYDDTGDFATAAQGALADSAVQPGDLATVATTGEYNDLLNKPTIPAAQVNSDWTSVSGVSEILNKPTLGTSAALDAGVPLGVATLDSGGTVPTSQLPASVLGAVKYQGTWDASTNTPTLTSSVGTQGYYYVVSVAGSTNLNGITEWKVNDWAIFNGSVWQKIDNTDQVTSVNGYTGVVNLTYTDVGAFPATLTTGTGKVVLQDGATINTSTLSQATVSNYLGFNTTAGLTPTYGQITWGARGTPAVGLDGGSGVVGNVLEDSYVYVKATAIITKGQACMFTGTVGASGVVTAAPATGISDGSLIIGIAAESIPLNSFGLIQTTGTLKGLDTSMFSNGDILWYDPTVTGGLTATQPVAPNVKVQMAAVINSGSGGSGSVQIRITAGSTLGGTDSNVLFTGLAANNMIQYNGTVWSNISDITGITIGGQTIATLIAASQMSKLNLMGY